MRADVIYPTENSVLKAMKETNTEKVEMFISAYVDDSNYQSYGFSLVNINSDYYFNQKIISEKTKTFILT